MALMRDEELERFNKAEDELYERLRELIKRLNFKGLEVACPDADSLLFRFTGSGYTLSGKLTMGPSSETASADLFPGCHVMITFLNIGERETQVFGIRSPERSDPNSQVE